MSRPVRRAFLAAAALFAVLAVACASHSGPADTGDPALFEVEPDVRATVTMRDIRFEPAQIEAPPGALIAIEFVNEGDIEHDFSVDRFGGAFAVRTEGASSAHGSSRAVHMALRPGQRGEVRVRVAEAGTVEFFCDVPGHRRGGMVGTIDVR